MLKQESDKVQYKPIQIKRHEIKLMHEESKKAGKRDEAYRLE